MTSAAKYVTVPQKNNSSSICARFSSSLGLRIIVPQDDTKCTLLPSEKKKASGREGAQVTGATGVAEPRGRKDTLRVAH